MISYIYIATSSLTSPLLSIVLDTQPTPVFALPLFSSTARPRRLYHMAPAGSYHPSPYSSPRERQRKIDDVEDDKQSTLSHSSGVPRTVQPGKEALRLVAGNRVRHARCAPDFLEEIGTKGIPDSLRRATSKKFRVVSGTEARTYFKNYIVCAYTLCPGVCVRALTHRAFTVNTTRENRKLYELLTNPLRFMIPLRLLYSQ